MVDGRGVEVELRVRDVALAVGVERLLEVADPHVVAGDREVVAVQRPLGDAQVANRGGQGLGRVEPLVGRPARRLALGDLAAPGDPTREAGAARDVDPHAEQMLARLGEDLRQAGRAVEVGRGLGVGPTRRLEEDDGLERVGRDPARLRGPLDERAKARDTPRRRDGAARALEVERLGEPGGGPALERRPLADLVGERVDLPALAAGERRDARALGRAAAEDRDHERAERDERDQSRDPTAPDDLRAADGVRRDGGTAGR